MIRYFFYLSPSKQNYAKIPALPATRRHGLRSDLFTDRGQIFREALQSGNIAGTYLGIDAFWH